MVCACVYSSLCDIDPDLDPTPALDPHPHHLSAAREDHRVMVLLSRRFSFNTSMRGLRKEDSMRGLRIENGLRGMRAQESFRGLKLDKPDRIEKMERTDDSGVSKGEKRHDTFLIELVCPF